ncbi:MAG: cation:proton antiporter [Armatimonadota bacterium]|nr:cation:proton antiporter [Armatimonadota bacterium]
MTDTWTAMLMGMLIFAAALVSVEVGISVALIEIMVGVLAGNILGLHTTPWIDFLAGLGGIVLTFLAGAEVDTDMLREQFTASLWVGGLSFLLPFLAAWGFALWVLDWTPSASRLAGVALSTTSLAVVYAVLVETGLTQTPLGKLIMASTFITDFGTAAALSILFARPTPWILAFLAVSAVIIAAMPRLQPWFFRRYGNRIIEPEIKGAFAALLVLYTTLLMSTGLTFGTISSLYGLHAGIIDRTQFSLLVTAVILSAVVPTVIAQRVCDPRRAGLRPQPAPAVRFAPSMEGGEDS